MKNIRGIIGAVIGAIIGALPWLLVYIYGNYIVSVLALFIALGANFLYRKFGGEVNKKLPVTIGVVSVLTISLITFILVPILLLAKEHYSVNSYTLKILYSDSTFMSGLVHDLLISILFVIMGIVPVINNIKREVGVEVKSDTDAVKQKENIEKMKEIFRKYNAFDKENAVTYEELKENFNEDDDKIFNQVKRIFIIKKYKNKYYFSEKNENNPNLAQLLFALKFSLIIIIFIVFITVITMNI